MDKEHGVQGQTAAWLDALASASPTPGGGGAAALGASVAGSLICMVCNLTIGKPKYAAYEAQMSAALAQAETARRAALELIDDDARVFDALMAAYKLPKGTDPAKQARASAIEQALVDAAAVPLRVAALCAEIIGLSHDMLEGANKNVLSDVAVAAALARGALASSMVNVEINLGGMSDESRSKAIADELQQHSAALDQADMVVRQVRQRIAR